MPTFEEEREKTKKEEEERLKLAQFRAMMEEAAKTVQRGTPSQQVQTEPLSLSGDQIKEYQGRLTKNLDDREKLRGFLMSFLKRDGIDPTAPTDASRDYSVNMTPDMLAREMKQRDREGKSGIGNFFRNIDYALGDGSGRDKASAEAQQKTAIMALQDILRDNGTEIRNTMGDQAKLAKNWMELQQRGGKIQADNATKQAGVEQKAVDSSYQNAMTGIRGNDMLSMNPFKRKLIESQVKVNENRASHTPMGIFSKDMNEILHIQRLRDAGQNEMADLLEKELTRRKDEGLKNQLALKGGMDTNRGQLLQGVDKDGNVTYKEARVGNKVINPWREQLMKRLQGGMAPQGQATSTVTYDGAEPITQTLTKAARNVTTPQKAIQTVDKALGKAASDVQKQHIAVQALTEGLTKEQIERNASRALLGNRYTVYDAPTDPRIINTGMKKSGQAGAAKLSDFAEYDLKISTPAKSIMKAASSGMLKKAFGASVNPLTTFRNLSGGTMPEGFRKATTSEIGTDPTRLIDNTFPNLINSKDPEVNSFITSLKELVASSQSAIQLKNTGKAVTEFEINQLAERLPKPSDTPEVALEKMLTFTINERISGYLARKGYSATQIQGANNYMNDFVGPRVKDIVKQIGDAKASYANKLVNRPEDAIKNLDVTSIDPEDMIGDAMYQATKKPGSKATLKDIERDTGIKVSRLIPDEDPQGKPIMDPRGQQLIEELRKLKQLPKRKK